MENFGSVLSAEKKEIEEYLDPIWKRAKEKVFEEAANPLNLLLL